MLVGYGVPFAAKALVAGGTYWPARRADTVTVVLETLSPIYPFCSPVFDLLYDTHHSAKRVTLLCTVLEVAAELLAARKILFDWFCWFRSCTQLYMEITEMYYIFPPFEMHVEHSFPQSLIIHCRCVTAVSCAVTRVAASLAFQIKASKFAALPPHTGPRTVKSWLSVWI